jgi:hypothetical protein
MQTKETGLEIKWAHLVSPGGESRQGFWVLNNGVPVEEWACFETKEEAEDWIRSFNWL